MHANSWDEVRDCMLSAGIACTVSRLEVPL
jgi:hypothetical protein